MSASVYKVVHAYAVDNQQNARSFESAQYRAPASLLAFLYQYLPALVEKVGYGLLVRVVDIVFWNGYDVLWRIDFPCVVAVDAYNDFVKVYVAIYCRTVGFIGVYRS